MARLWPACFRLISLLGAFLAIPAGFAAGRVGLPGSPAAGAPPADASPTILVLGFVGGFVRHDEPRHPEVQLIRHLRQEYGGRVEGRVFENRRQHDAYRMIRQHLDTNHDGQLSAEEKQNARILLFGHSWGASTVVSLAWRLERDGIPVVLTVQIDSVAKVGQNDSLIPPNVREAANFYQQGGWLHGRKRITAADPARTTILGNYQLSYQNHSIDCSGSPWLGRVFTRGHIQIERDPAVWSRIDALIRTQLPKLISADLSGQGSGPAGPAEADLQ
jgi:pimeloyl-ACP methyl ester carboxylesterase